MCPDAREVATRNRDFEIAVRPRLSAEPKIDRPAADDTPRHTDAFESCGRFARMPCMPGVERWSVPMWIRVHRLESRKARNDTRGEPGPAIRCDNAAISVESRFVETIHTFAGNPFDRADAQRRDPAWLEAAVRAPDSRYLP